MVNPFPPTHLEHRAPSRVAILGAGISGLAAALKIRQLSPQTEVIVFDQQARPGGVLGTVREDGFQVERSADNFITTLPWAMDLCRQLELGEHLVSTHPEHRRAFVVWRRRLHPLPDGFLMMAPSEFWPLATTPLLSLWGKLRAAMEYVLPPRLDEDDESLAGFARRRLGREVFERLVEPLVTAVYGADTERLSVLATLARFREMEKKYGSLIRAMRAQKAARKAGTHSGAKTPRESGARYSMFATLRFGLEQLVEEIVSRLPQDALRLGTRVTGLARGDSGWLVALDNGDVFPCDAVVLAVPAYAAARIVEQLDQQLSQELAGITYTGSVILALAYRREDVGHPLDGSGCVIPAVEKSPLLAVSFSSQKYPHLSPKGTVLLRVFAGGARRPDLVIEEESRLRTLLRSEVESLLRIRGEPVREWLFRWPAAMPQYEVGHLQRLRRIEERLECWPGLALAGNAYRGVGIPHCIRSGWRAAGRVLGFPQEDHETGSSPF
ncbi:protoporphyrinogen oxidase [Thermogutta sp.]|uniref:protoporphyrinogen oxidase n=1 Tax=Thermogutta sp. TaxID=1962930 RepID=UPI00321F6F5B